MSEDILRQAELRHQRRPRSRQGEEILPLDTGKTKTTTGDRLSADLYIKSSLPPIRNQGQEQSPRSTSPYGPRPAHTVTASTTEADKQRKREPVSIENGLLTPLDRPRTPRRRISSHTDSNDANGSAGENYACLPFVKCMVKDREMKALVSTLSPMSSISRRCLENNRGNKPVPPKEIKLANSEFPVNLILEESGIHDLILGLDFLLKNKCVLDFGTKELKLDGGKTEPILPEHDIPLKFRNKKELSLSI